MSTDATRGSPESHARSSSVPGGQWKGSEAGFQLQSWVQEPPSGGLRLAAEATAQVMSRSAYETRLLSEIPRGSPATHGGPG